MLHGSDSGIDVELVLSEFPRYTWHVSRLPCEDVPILTEELDERIFLWDRQVRADDGMLAGVAFDEVDALRVLGWFESKGRVAVRGGFLQDRVVVRIGGVLRQLLGVVYLRYDYCVGEFGASRLAVDGEVVGIGALETIIMVYFIIGPIHVLDNRLYKSCLTVLSGNIIHCVKI